MKKLKTSHIGIELDRLIGVVNSFLDVNLKPWTDDERKNGRLVPIDTDEPEIVSRLRDLYAAPGPDWDVYAMKVGTQFHLEFWPPGKRCPQ